MFAFNRTGASAPRQYLKDQALWLSLEGKETFGYAAFTLAPRVNHPEQMHLAVFALFAAQQICPKWLIWNQAGGKKASTLPPVRT